MSRGLDVLAALEEAACALRIDGRDEQAMEMEDARSAINDLIEAADGMQIAHGRVAFLAGSGAPMNYDYWMDADFRLKALREALGLVKGELK